MEGSADWIRWAPVISAVVSGIALVVTAIGVVIAAANILRSLDRAKRELAVNLFYNWNKDIDWITSRLLDLATRLPNPTILTIKAKLPATIASEHYDTVVSILSEVFDAENLPKRPDGQSKEFGITAEHSAFIYFHWGRWLNRLESALAGWFEDTADSRLIKTQFAPLLKSYTKVLDIPNEGLTVINAFLTEIKSEEEPKKRPRLTLFSRRDR
jgi:hypothetical protein